MWRQRGNQTINQERTASARCFSLSVCLSILSASRGGCCGMVAARFSPAPSGMIEGISAGAHEIERHDRSTCDIDLVVWCLAGGEIGARCDFGGKVLPLFFPLSGCCCSLVARLPRLSRCCSRALSVCASSRTRPLASLTWPDIPSLAPLVCISHSSNPPLLVPLVRLSLLLRLSSSRVGLDRLHIPVTRSAPCLLVDLLAASRWSLACTHRFLRLAERPPRCLCSPWKGARARAKRRLLVVCNAALPPRYARGVAGSMQCFVGL